MSPAFFVEQAFTRVRQTVLYLYVLRQTRHAQTFDVFQRPTKTLCDIPDSHFHRLTAAKGCRLVDALA